MSNVIKLNSRNRSPDDLIEILSKKSEVGEIAHLMFCVIDTAGQISVRFSTADLPTLLAMASYTDHEVKRTCLGFGE